MPHPLPRPPLPLLLTLYAAPLPMTLIPLPSLGGQLGGGGRRPGAAGGADGRLQQAAVQCRPLIPGDAGGRVWEGGGLCLFFAYTMNW